MRYADLVPEVLREAPEAPHPTIEAEIRDSAIHFCKQSRVWREHRTLLLNGADQYRLRASKGGRVDQIIRALYVNVEGGKTNLVQIPDRENMRPQPGCPRRYSFGRRRDDAVIRLRPYPEDGEIDLFVVLVPQIDSADLPDYLNEEWKDPIVDGAIARLLTYSNKPWSEPGNSSRFHESFLLGVRDARQQAVSDDWTHSTVKLRKWV